MNHRYDECCSKSWARLARCAWFHYVGSGDGEITGIILQTLMERDNKELDEKWARFMSLGLALPYVGCCLVVSADIVTHFLP